MTIAVRGAGSRYDVRPARENHGIYGGPFGSFACMIKDACQGAGAGFLSLTGATAIASGETVAAAGGDLGMLSAVFPSLAASGMTGPLQLAAGVLLFLAARRTVSRTLGLMAFIVFAAAVANGYTLADMLAMAANFLEGAAGVVESIPVADSQSV